MRIFGYTYNLQYEKFLGGMGQQHSADLSIKLDPRLPQQQQASTVLHEIIEAVNSHLELGLTHQQIMGLEVGLYETLREIGVADDLYLRELEHAD